MDPLSITAGCIGIISTITKTSTSITHFVRDVRDSRRELSETKQQLAELEMTLNLINDDHNREDGNLAQQMPEGIIQQTKLVLDSCREILVELDALISKYNTERRRTAFQWARKGKDEVLALNKQLEAHSRTLHMSLEFSTLIWSRVGAENTVVLRQESRTIIENTEQVMGDTGEIKLATTHLLEGMNVLKSQAALKEILDEVEKIKVLISQQNAGDRGGRQDVMRRYLDSLKDYGESEMGGESPNHDDSAHSAELTPRLAGMALDPFDDPIDLQDGSFENRIHRRATIPDSPNVSQAIIPQMQAVPPPRKYLNPDSPLSILVIGMAQQGKTTFINYILQLSPDKVPFGQVGNTTYADEYKTESTTYDVEIPASRYVLLDMLNGKECKIPDITTATEADLEPWIEAPKSKYSLKPIDPNAPYVKLRLIDVPSFHDSREGFESGMSVEPIFETLKRMSNSWGSREKHISAAVVVLSCHSALSFGLVAQLKQLFHHMPKLEDSLTVMNTHCSVDLWLGVGSSLSDNSESEPHPWLDYTLMRAAAFQHRTGLGPGQFFINSVPVRHHSFEELLSKNTAIDFILFLLEKTTGRMY